ncbi:MAG: thymidylate synthase, partial [bacterium]|nr:thymidylate synthase [bacterium]
FTVNIIGGRLHFHNIVRSNDMVLGFPADVAGFALLQMILAQKLGVQHGIYTHSISNAHIYDNHYEGAKELVKRTNEHPPIRITLPENSYDRAEQKDRTLVDEIFAQFKKQYEPMPKIESVTPKSIAI